MDELKYIKIFLLGGIPSLVFFIIFIILLATNSSSGDSSVLAVNYFSIPFENKEVFTITSNYGKRTDPMTGEESFHTGIDLGAAEGTSVLASADGYVVETGFQEGGLGNYVYIEHRFSDLIFYSAYGHLLDDSIVVSEGQKVVKGEKIAGVGSTGRSTGNHLHFTIMTPKISFQKQYLVDPTNIIKGLD